MAPPLSGNILKIAPGMTFTDGLDDLVIQEPAPLNVYVGVEPGVLYFSASGAAFFASLQGEKVGGELVAPVNCWNKTTSAYVVKPAGTVVVLGGFALLAVGDPFGYRSDDSDKFGT